MMFDIDDHYTALCRRETKARRGDREYLRSNEKAKRHNSSCTHGHFLHYVTGR